MKLVLTLLGVPGNTVTVNAANKGWYDPTGAHAFRVGRLAGLLAEELGMDREAAEQLELAARLRDIGKLVIPEVPAGRYKLHLWYEAAMPEELDAMTREIVVSEKTAALGVLPLKVSALPKTHHNKYGQEYEPPSPGNPAYVRP